jgi:hypothetical protein
MRGWGIVGLVQWRLRRMLWWKAPSCRLVPMRTATMIVLLLLMRWWWWMRLRLRRRRRRHAMCPMSMVKMPMILALVMMPAPPLLPTTRVIELPKLLWLLRLRASVDGNGELRAHLPTLGLVGALLASLWCLRAAHG